METYKKLDTNKKKKDPKDLTPSPSHAKSKIELVELRPGVFIPKATVEKLKGKDKV
jgi:hypothetical protein